MNPVHVHALFLGSPVGWSPKMTRDFMVRNKAPHAVLYQWCPRKKAPDWSVVDSGFWSHLKVDSWILKVDSQPAWKDSGTPTCLQQQSQSIFSRFPKVQMCLLQWWAAILKPIPRGSPWTWCGWYGKYTGAIPDTKSCCFKRVHPFGKNLNLFFEDIRRRVQWRPSFQKKLKDQDGHCSWICSPSYPQVFIRRMAQQRFIKLKSPVLFSVVNGYRCPVLWDAAWFTEESDAQFQDI